MGGLDKPEEAKQPEATKSITVTPDMLVSDYEFKVDVHKSVPKLQPNEYQCASCFGVFDKGWSDDEAEAEYSTLFPASAASGAERVIVCDDCFKLMTAWKPPSEYEVTDLPIEDSETKSRQAEAQS